eukprot:symbB.v1.2.002602.t1/scaffold135.1/size305288/22
MDASDVLTLEPKNHHALQVVARKRQSLNNKADLGVNVAAEASVAAFLFTEDRPLQCYACLKSLKHLRNARLNVTVFWQATERACLHSYQLLEALPELRLQGEVVWQEVKKGQLFEKFSRSVGRLSVEGIRNLLILSDAAVFHTDVDLSAATAVLSDRNDTFAVRLDLNPRVEFFPKSQLSASAPHLKPFANDGRVLLWTRSFDASKMAYEAVPRESGWDEILDWTASMVRAAQISHFFSALQGQVSTLKEMDDKVSTICIDLHLSSSIFQVISIALMGCTATKAATAAVDPKHQMIDMDQSDLMDMDSSFDTWKFKNLPKGVSAPPSRRMHDRHLSKLDGFKETVEQNPLTFQIVVKIRRDLAEFEEAKDSSLSHTLIAQI